MSGERVVPQLSDPLVRRMADQDHTPTEMWAMGGHLISLHCDACGQSWPCETRRALQSATKQDHSYPRSPAGDKSQAGESSQDMT